MNIRHLMAGTAIVFGALAASTGVATALPSVGYVPHDDPKTPINEAGSVQTNLNPDEAAGVAWALSPLNPISPISQQIQQAQQDSDCVAINSTSLTDHTATGYKVGDDGVCNQPVS